VASLGLPILAAVFGWLALSTHVWLLLWPAVVMVAVAVVYAARAPRAFGKRADGTLAWYAWLIWAPWFTYMWIAHELARRATREPVANEVAPGVWVGRRPRPGELPAGTAVVVDLCAEFPRARGIAEGRTYVTIPTLDATAPTPSEIAHAVDVVLATPGAAFIHCAFGHGRSATVAAAVLIRRGDATLDDVEAKMKSHRPRIGLNAGQRRALAASLASGATLR
jgi:protein-tyrosine phosphatase